MMLKIDANAPYPRFEFCRLRKKDEADYFGPFTSSTALRVTREFAEREFGLRLCKPHIPDAGNYKHCNNDIIRFCSAPCIARISQADYKARVDEACAFLRGERPRYIKRLRQEMEQAAAAREYEKAAVLRDTIKMIRQTIEQKVRAPKSLEVKRDEARQGVSELEKVLGLEHPPRLIECFDISNISGTLSVGSMVCAVDGRPHRNRYRHFRIKSVAGADDPRSIAEVVGRQIERTLGEGGKLPDLIVCDGGITQVRAAIAILDSIPGAEIPVIGLAKRFEEIVRDENGRAETLLLPRDSKALIVLQNLRDEAHRFAITYHRKLRNRRISESILDDIPGIGAKKKENLLRHFGSIRRLRAASLEEVVQAPGIGPKLGTTIFQQLADKTRQR
jgi:excinuclease ABC subunit C